MIDKPIIVNIKQQLRDILILEYGEIWLQFCEESGISPDIRMAYLDYLNKYTDAI